MLRTPMGTMNRSPNEGALTYAEIARQADALRETFERAPARFVQLAQAGPLTRFNEVVFTGCGSSYHIALYAAHVWGRLTGLRARALPASEILHFPDAVGHMGSPPLVFAISRSGGTDETILAVERARASWDATVVALTTEAECALGSLADVHLVFEECPEQSPITTGSLPCMMYGLLLLADACAGGTLRGEAGQLPPQVERSARVHEDRAREHAEDLAISRFVFLGSGPLFALAAEAALKMIEMALTPAHFYHTLEFRHGPHLLLTEQTLVVIFLTEAERPYVSRLIADIREADARTWIIGDRALEDLGRPRASHVELSRAVSSLAVGSGLSELMHPILFAHLVQYLAFWRAKAVGVNPDAPPRLTRTVRWGAPDE